MRSGPRGSDFCMAVSTCAMKHLRIREVFPQDRAPSPRSDYQPGPPRRRNSQLAVIRLHARLRLRGRQAQFGIPLFNGLRQTNHRSLGKDQRAPPVRLRPRTGIRCAAAAFHGHPRLRQRSAPPHRPRPDGRLAEIRKISIRRDPPSARITPPKVSPAITRRSQTPRSTWPQPEDSSSRERTAQDAGVPARVTRPCATRLRTVAVFFRGPLPGHRAGAGPTPVVGSASRRRSSASTWRPFAVPAAGRT